MKDSVTSLGKKCLLSGAVAVVSAMVALPVLAASSDPRIDEARQCTMHFPKNERLQGIPTHLLAAIASTESGRWNDTLGMVIPWPWTINADGQGFYFDSKQEAIAKVRQLQAKGVRSIDVGCMQVSLKHHPNAFSSLEEAFDPQYNIAYASKFLRTNYEDLGSWPKATAAYHSRTPKYGNPYLTQIEKSWNSIVGKVREARGERGLSSGQYAVRMAAQDRQQFASLAPEAGSSPVSRRAATSALPSSRTVKVIKVNDESAEPKRSARQETMVIRPKVVADGATKLKADDGAALQAVASANPDLLVVNYNGTSKSSVVRGETKTSNSPSKSSGPKFVFVQ